jgi:hypothetical protein
MSSMAIVVAVNTTSWCSGSILSGQERRSKHWPTDGRHYYSVPLLLLLGSIQKSCRHTYIYIAAASNNFLSWCEVFICFIFPSKEALIKWVGISCILWCSEVISLLEAFESNKKKEKKTKSCRSNKHPWMKKKKKKKKKTGFQRE